LDELFAATRSKLKFNNPVSFDEKRPSRALARRTEYRQIVKVDYFRVADHPYFEYWQTREQIPLPHHMMGYESSLASNRFCCDHFDCQPVVACPSAEGSANRA
jgi:hypothetical protein